MDRASKPHNLLAQNAAQHLRGKGGQGFVGNVRLAVRENAVYAYPDVLVACNPADRRDACLVRHLVLITEILSASTADATTVRRNSLITKSCPACGTTC